MSQVKSAKRPAKTTALRFEDFHYLSDLKITLPQLVLGIRIPRELLTEDFPVRSYRFKPGRTWLKFAHQTAGMACREEYWVGTTLMPAVSVAKALPDFIAGYDDRNLGAFGVTMDELTEYRADLQRRLNVDCNRSYRYLAEGSFPIDTEHLSKLTPEALPRDYDDFIDFSSGMERAMGCIGRWHVAILSDRGID